MEKAIKLAKRHKRLNRSGSVTLISFIFVLILGMFMSLPFVYSINNAFKPLDELFIYPPRLFVSHPTLKNFSNLFVIMGESELPFTRYFFNTFFITLAGTAGHVLAASLAAFVLAKYKFPGSVLIFQIVVISLMFVQQVTAIPNFITMSSLKWVDTPLALFIPAIGTPLGLFLMKQFMESMVPTEILESARMDGAGILTIFIKMAMPMVKPAWLTLIIFDIQSLWNATGNVYIISEDWKTLPYALSQIVSGGIARAGVGSATAVIIMIIPIFSFIISQSRIVETMSTSGIKG